MANSQYYNYPGFGEWAQKNLGYAQAVRVGDRIVCSGQGGWNGEKTEVTFDSLIEGDLIQEIDRAFENCDRNLRHAGGKGWSQVYRVVTYSTNISSQHERIMYNMRKWMPDHNATWTELGVKELGSPQMHIEIEVEAYDPEGAADAKK
ncbi:hypothetical protein PT974_02998 [Cladobotryum mycophilum]|uniref:Uncharacterized protein n=1 Tax=Cladobotryum mycophilum TaxID=491253 RepID=A0ABR0SZL8_9HYPO